MDNVQNRLKQVRGVLNLTQEEFGKPVGLKHNNIRDLEAGRVNISKLHAISFEYVYSISSRWLLKGYGEMFIEGNDEKTIKQKRSQEFRIDIDLLSTIIEVVYDFEIETQKSFESKHKAELIGFIYEDFSEDKKMFSKKKIRKYIQFVKRLLTN